MPQSSSSSRGSVYLFMSTDAAEIDSREGSERAVTVGGGSSGGCSCGGGGGGGGGGGFCDGGLNILFCRASQAAGSAFVYIFLIYL